MADGKFEVHIDRTPDEVWALISDFGGLEGWMPGIDACTLDGDVRTVQTANMEVKERLVSQDDAARTQSYSIIDGPIPIEHHLATLSVEPDGDGSKFTWAFEVLPDEMAGAFGPIYEGSAQAVKAQLEG
ncbi:MAG TPA: SRPBCC family protein [Acidimicrobiales bacterium]|nr:SRPBCC family protein [Acidimicrobiales bacterium]